MVEPVADSTTAPLGIRLALIALLPLLALALYLDGQRYDPDLVELAPRQAGTQPAAALFPDTVTGLQRAGQATILNTPLTAGGLQPGSLHERRSS